MDERIGRDHLLIHTIEGEVLAVGTPKESATNPELILMYRLSVDDGRTAVGGELLELPALGEVDVIALDDRCMLGRRIEKEGLLALSILIEGRDELTTL